MIGIDVGGTNTDAAILEMKSKIILSASKTSTTKDIESGITNSIKGVLSQAAHIDKS